MPESGLRAGVVGRRADVADAAMRAGLEVAGEIVVPERQSRQRGNVRRDHEPQNYAQPTPGSAHVSSIRRFRRKPLTGAGQPVSGLNRLSSWDLLLLDRDLDANSQRDG